MLGTWRRPTLKVGPNRFRLIDLLVLAACAFLVVQAPLSVMDAAWVPNLNMLARLAVAGLLAGYVIERTRVPGLFGLPLGMLLGIELITLVFADLAEPGPLGARVNWLGGRVGVWLETIVGGGVSNDPLVFAIAMATLAWVLGLITAWLVFRDDAPWLAIVCNGLALLMNLSYAPQSLVGYVTWFAAAACLLLAANQLARRTELWRRAQLRVGWRVVGNVLLGVAVAVGSLLSLAWALPSNLASPAVAAGWGRATAPWSSMEGEFDRWFAAISGSSRNARGLSFGRTLAPRGAFDLGDTPVLQVRAPGPLYLRATTADRYAGQAITSSDTTTAEFAASADLVPEDALPEARAAIQAQIKVLASRTAVGFAPDAPLRFSVATQVDSRGNPDDLAAIRLADPAQQNQEYGVVSAFSVATNQELRAAGEIYPDWVRERYLQLPRRMPRRVLDLARSVTEGATNPFDKATRIETFLRDELTYSTHVPAVPTDRDWVDYFLFDSREGYCDYFATAMVVLLRMDGVPARAASGFAPGELDPTTGLSLVRENHAHTWVEVYFPRYGWVTFEPSAIRPVPTRLEQPEEQAPPPVPQSVGSTDADQLTIEELDELLGLQSGGGFVEPRPQPLLGTLLTTLGLGLAVIAALVGFVALVIAFAWRGGLGQLAIYQRPYAQLMRLGSWVGSERPAPSVTPFELADSLARQVPGAGSAIREVTAAYVEGTYASRPPERDPWPVWLAARRDVLRGMIRRRLRRWFGDDGSQPTAPRSHPELLRGLRDARNAPRRDS